ncbi:MAG: hypothetical protein JRI54_03640, partial [Deltaproteobacteria bacterium]|nr:hypothetical protein [Deltaproteobacteria bacterium]
MFDPNEETDNQHIQGLLPNDAIKDNKQAGYAEENSLYAYMSEMKHHTR